MKEVRVALDAMGGDNAPAEIVKGAVEAVSKNERLKVFLVGKEAEVKKELAASGYAGDSISVVPASEVIGTADHPVEAIRKKKDSSIVVGLRMVKNNEADAFASSGNSGAVMVGGQAIVGRIRGIERPPFASVIPTEKGCSLLLDCGANVDTRSDHLVKFARIGSIYMSDVVGVKDPSVGLVNIGAEEDKGNMLVKETMPLLKECDGIRFIGSVEARDIPAGAADVLVCDGFAGNIVLKMYEGTATVLLRVIKKGLMSSLRTKIGALLIKPALKNVLKDYDATAYGGAPLIGLKGLVVKMHGNAKSREVNNTLMQCIQFYDAQIPKKIEEHIAQREIG